MKKEIKIKYRKKSKRKISIITVFIGIFLLLIICKISQKGLNNINFLETDRDLNITLEKKFTKNNYIKNEEGIKDEVSNDIIDKDFENVDT